MKTKTLNLEQMNIKEQNLNGAKNPQCAIAVVSGIFSVGDYVFLSKYSDADPNDPWYVGTADEIGIDHKGGFIRCYEAGVRTWRNAVKIDKEEGENILSVLANYR